MDKKSCRDCGFELESNARGCPNCALNLEAENMIDRLVWRRLVPGLVIAVTLAAALFYLLR